MNSSTLNKLLEKLATGEKTLESSIQNAFVGELKKYGWKVYSELWVQKDNSNFRIDLAAYHNFYSTLGWFVFELDLGTFSEVTNCHKKIVSKYAGCHFHDVNYPMLDGITPVCFVAVFPYHLRYDSGNLEWDEKFYSWIWVSRFFNSYGIGVLRGDQIFFEPNGAYWSSVYLNPNHCRYGLPNQNKLRNFLKRRLNT